MPTKEEIKAARLQAGLTQEEAGRLVGTGWKYWQQWEYGKRPMRPPIWELFLIKTNTARRRSGDKN
jgi:DNA-binding transcriptional regulator YiaG